MTRRQRTDRPANRIVPSIALGLLAALAAVQAPSATAAEVELTPTLAYRSGGFSCNGAPVGILETTDLIFPPPPCGQLGAETEDDVAIGAILGIGIGNGLQVEVLINRQEAEQRRRLDGFPFDFPSLPGADVTVSHLQAGLSKTWGHGTVRPFLAAAAGVSRVDADDPVRFTDFREDAFSTSLGGGVKTFFDDRFGLRFEARGYWVDLPSEVGGTYTQEELSVGAILRW